MTYLEEVHTLAVALTFDKRPGIRNTVLAHIEGDLATEYGASDAEIAEALALFDKTLNPQETRQ